MDCRADRTETPRRIVDSHSDRNTPGTPVEGRAGIVVRAAFTIGLKSTPRSTKIADPARLLPVRKIAEMAHQGGHTTLVAISVTDHLVDLCPFLLTLGEIGLAPWVVAAAHVLGVVHQGSAVGPELLESLVEHLFIYPEL